MVFTILDVIGTMAFAISGGLTAMEKKMDVFGISIVAICTALGGGTLRDMLIGNTPVAWLLNLQNFYVAILTIIVTIIFRRQLNKLRRSLLLFDTIGMGVFTLIGIQTGVQIGLHPLVCILLGTITACFGGVIRDILCNEIPLIFSREIYATACLVGGALYFLLVRFHLPLDLVYFATIALIITVRLMAVYHHWSLPRVKLPGY
ncbi:MAG: trimeric intracellular cation channel family protein [Sphingobacterium sp.]